MLWISLQIFSKRVLAGEKFVTNALADGRQVIRDLKTFIRIEKSPRKHKYMTSLKYKLLKLVFKLKTVSNIWQQFNPTS